MAEAIISKRVKEVSVKDIKVSGAIFCQVRRIPAWAHIILLITWGNQKWKGAAPLFRAKARVVAKEGANINDVLVFCEKIMVLVIIRTDAKACTKKYLMAVSEL